MNKEMFVEFVKQLNSKRCDVEELKTELAMLLKKLETIPEYESYSQKKDKTKELSKEVTAIEVEFRKSMLEDIDFVPPFKAAWLTNSTTVEIDENAALVWAKENMKAAVKEVVDIDMLSNFAKDHPEESSSFAKIIKGKEVKIAKDLDKFEGEMGY